MKICEKVAEVLVSFNTVDQNRYFQRRSSRQLDGRSYECANPMSSCGQMSLNGSVHPHVVQNGNGFVVEFSCTLNEILWMARASKEGKRGSRIEFSKQV